MKTDEKIEARREEELHRWWEARAGALPIWAWIVITLAVVALALGVGSWWTFGRGGRMPPVEGFYQGEEVTFIHTEASDAKVAQTLTGMVSSPVLVVPELADVPDSALGTVYVFTNGVRGAGPMGFQPDVFDTAPTNPDYRPLREVHLVAWRDEANPRVLTSAAEVEAAADRGELEIRASGIVVNMPFLTWPGGSR